MLPLLEGQIRIGGQAAHWSGMERPANGWFRLINTCGVATNKRWNFKSRDFKNLVKNCFVKIIQKQDTDFTLHMSHILNNLIGLCFPKRKSYVSCPYSLIKSTKAFTAKE